MGGLVLLFIKTVMGTVVNRSCHCIYGEPRKITFRFSKFLKRDIKFEF